MGNRRLSAITATLAMTWLTGCTSPSEGDNSSAGGGAGDGGGPPVGSGFIAHYDSPFPSPHIHFRLAGEAWTSPPGLAMTAEADGWFSHRESEGLRPVEFAFNDGKDSWDSRGGDNYETTLAEFWVRDGEISETKPGGFCETHACEHGTCSEAEARCTCSDGFLFEPVTKTCIQDPCADVVCEGGGLCDPETKACIAPCTPDRTVGDFSFCTLRTSSSYAVVVRYNGADELDLDASVARLNGQAIDTKAAYSVADKTFRISETGVAPSKYSYLFRLQTTTGEQLSPLFIPFWIGPGHRYAEFQWQDAILYQVMTDRFRNGDPTNDIDNAAGTLAEVDDVRSQWQGGDFRGIIQKLDDGYFDAMGISAIWVSSPLLNSHSSQPSVDPEDLRRFSSYHGYHPVVTGYTDASALGYANALEPAFGTPAELHELVNKAHAKGIRIIPDFVANHVQIEAQIYEEHPEWFFPFNPCHGNWDAHRIDCWFTETTPDFDYAVPEARKAVVDHAIWLIQEFNFDGFRADALKHMHDDFVRDLKSAVVSQIETTVDDHSKSVEPTVFYMVGESLGGWARYHVRVDMVQGQVDEEYYNQSKAALLTFNASLKNLAAFAVANDTRFLSPAPVMGGSGGYPGAVMGNFFGNHDQWRALTEAGGDHRRLRLAQAFLMTSPGNIPMLYQGDDIGTLGGQDPDNRKMQRFTDLSQDEAESLAQARLAGTARDTYPALRRGTRTSLAVEDWFWVYEVAYQGQKVIVALNRDGQKTYSPPSGYTDALGHCMGGVVPQMSACIFVPPASP